MPTLTKPTKKTAPKLNAADAATAADIATLAKLHETTSKMFRAGDELEDRIFAAFKRAKAKRLMLPDGRVASIKDNYSARNVAFKTCAFRAREIVVA